MIREKLEVQEATMLSPYATLARDSRGRQRHEEEDCVRTCFMRIETVLFIQKHLDGLSIRRKYIFLRAMITTVHA